MRQISIFKGSAINFSEQRKKNFIIDAKDRKLFIRVINICPQQFGLGKCCTEKTQEKPQKNKKNVECTVNKNVKFHLRSKREKNIKKVVLIL